MKPYRRIRLVKFVVLPAVILGLLVWGPQDASANPPEPQTAIAEVNGTSFVIEAGQTIAQGTIVHQSALGEPAGEALSSNTICSMPEIRLSQTLGASVNRGVIRVEITNDCRAVALEVDSYFDLDSPEGPFDGQQSPDTLSASGSLSGSTRYGTWAKSELNDPEEFGIDLLSAYAHIIYDDDGQSVSNGSSNGDKCGYFPLTGWYLISCVGSGSYSGPSMVWKATSSHGNNSLICNHTCLVWHRAKTMAYPGRRADYQCIQVGAIPYGTHWECHGLRVG